MEGGERNSGGPTEVYWGKLRRGDKEEPETAPLVAEKTSTAARKRKEAETDEEEGEEDELAEQLRCMSEKELNEKIARMNRSFLVAQRTSDGGEKFRLNIKRHEDELERRKLQIKDGEKCEEAQFHDLSCSCAADGYQQENPSLVPNSGSHFATSFLKKMDEKTNHMTENVFKKEESILNRSDCQMARSNVYRSLVGRHKGELSSRQTPFQSCRSLSINVDKQNQLNGDQKCGHSRTPSPRHPKDALPNLLGQKHFSRVEHSNDLKHHNTVVLVDEEESEIAEVTQQNDQVDECMKEARIYYPSRKDPESMEIRYSELKCLAPEAYLSSTIMNFYIWYLQQHRYSTGKQRCNYHFFNTYFYEKVKVAISKNDRESSFAKVRRWWKGVRLFEKAYIFVPINENLHWSLVIICIPNREAEIGPVMLHLDSLGLHSSKSIFDNIKRFLIGEWEFLRKGEALPYLPLANKIWDNLPHKIHEKKIEVPLQRNDHDCGLFVLLFIERFIEKASERLKKKDLAMFGREWFKPAEASSLRQKIRNLLKEEFNRAREKGCLLDA